MEIYPNHKTQQIKIAVDNCIFTIKEDQLNILLIKMKEKYVGKWALPGGLINNNETLNQAAKRILKEQTSVSKVYLEQLYTFSEIDRDSSNRVISTAYYSLISKDFVKLRTSTKYADVRWWPISYLPKLAYDHYDIVATAKKRLENKIVYSNIAWSLLPAKFTLTELQLVYEIILDKKLDKRNFRKKLLNLDIIIGLKEKVISGAHRPAQLYQFKDKSFKFIDIL